MNLTKLPPPSAVLSECGRYRYRLERPAYPFGVDTVNIIMLNPSTADAMIDDPTIRRCVGFAKSWGYTRLVVTNLFAFRATDPRRLVGMPLEDLVGPDNDRHLRDAAADAACVVCAWGVNGALLKRDEAVVRMLRAIPVHLTAIKITKHGYPQHPLYLAANATPTPYRWRRVED